MGKNLIVKLDDEAEAGLEDGRYQYANGGIIDAKTKRFVRKYEYTGVTLEAGDVIVPCLKAKKIDEIYNRTSMMGNALSQTLQYSRESAILGLYTYQLTYEGFADISCKLEDLKGSIHEYFMQQKRTKYRKCMMDLKSVYAALIRPETNDNEFMFSTKLNDAASFLEELFEDYEAGKLDREESTIILMNLAVALQSCAEELRIYCFQKYGSKPASYDDWLRVVDLVILDPRISIAYRNRMYFNNPCASTSYIERRIKLPERFCKEMRLDTENKIRFIEDSGMTRKEYLGDPHRPQTEE